MAKQTFTTGQVLTAAQMTDLQATAMGGGAPVTKTASYVLVATDAGTVIQMNSASSTTITVNTGLFAAGDTVFIQNIGAGGCTITAGTATVNTAGNLGLTQWEGGTLYFTSTGAAIFFDIVQTSSAAAFVGCQVYKSADQTIATDTGTIVSFDSEAFDTDNFHDNATNNSRITIPTGKAGKYLIVASVQWQTSSNYRFINIYKNGSRISGTQLGVNADCQFAITTTRVESLSVGDYIQSSVQQGSGGSIALYSGTDKTTLSAVYLGA